MELSELLRKTEAIFAEELPAKINFPKRDGQIEMAKACARAFAQEQVLVTEAGTGVGKTLAYLVPAVLWRMAGGDQPVVIATHTLNLQQQILESDLPRLRDDLGFNFQMVLARGRSNYLCLHRLYALARSYINDPQVQKALNIIRERTHFEDKGGLFADNDEAEISVLGLRHEFPEVPARLWLQLSCENLACRKKYCRYFERCYLYKERAKLPTADIIVTNHALLLSDVAVRQSASAGILPSLERIVIDEAHHLEDVATDHLGYLFSPHEFRRFLNQVVLENDGLSSARGGFLPDFKEVLDVSPLPPDWRSDAETQIDRLIFNTLPTLRDAGHDVFEALGWRLQEKPYDKQELIVLTSAWFEAPTEAALLLKERLERLLAAFDNCTSLLKKLMATVNGYFDEDGPLGETSWNAGKSELVELQEICQQAAALYESFKFCIEPDKGQGEWVYWLRRQETALYAAPLDVSKLLSELLFAPCRTAVLTSATLSYQKTMEFTEERLGINLLERSVQRLIVASPFDYKKQALLSLVHDMPRVANYRNRNSTAAAMQSYYNTVTNFTATVARHLSGRTLVLATSWETVNQLKFLLEPQLCKQQQKLLVQQPELRNAQVKYFREHSNCVLLGTDSFWEGIDIPGAALKCVIIIKLPFKSPSDPVFQARCQKIEAQKRSSFQEYSLPLAVTKFRQGFGRLIRTVDDQGAVFVLDERIILKDYGHNFLQSLPGTTQIRGSLQEMFSKAKLWWDWGED